MTRSGRRAPSRARRPLRILAALVALFAAYVVGRAAGIVLGIGPYATEAVALVTVVVAMAWRSRAARDGED
jgi:hypothetical protein